MYIFIVTRELQVVREKTERQDERDLTGPLDSRVSVVKPVDPGPRVRQVPAVSPEPTVSADLLDSQAMTELQEHRELQVTIYT